MLDFIRTIFPVIIGSVIGYFTNYIAIKMLFHPYKELYLFGHRLPFTPGIIPKNKRRMATSVGKAVSEQLLTAESLSENIRESNVKEKLSDKVAVAVCENENTIHELLLHVDGGEHAMENASSKIANIVVEKLRQTDLQPIVEGVVNAAVANLAANPLTGWLMTEDMLQPVYIKFTTLLDDYIDKNGEEMAQKYLLEGLTAFEQQSVKHVLQRADITKDMIRKMTSDAFDYAVEKHGKSMMENIDIEGIVTNKIDSMDVPELEALLMAVMKQELQAVINLGAIIGAVIGAVNIFI